MTGLPVLTAGLVHIYRAEHHDVAALAGVDLSVQAGEMLALLGPSGAGKSTLLTLFGGLLRPSAGRIRIGDHELSRMSEPDLDALRGREVGIVLQGASRNLIPHKTMRENVAFAQGSRRSRGDVVPVDEVLDLVRLGERADLPLSSLTPGELQRGALAVAVSTKPGLLLGDEPTSQLDHDARDQVLQTLADINATWGTTVIVVTHDPEVAARMPRTVTIRDGRVGAEGREGEEFAVVSADGSVPLPPHVLATLTPGTLVRLVESDAGWTLVRDELDDIDDIDGEVPDGSAL
ncbi:ABC transporter ATP-binding protein [Knoellia flava]|uniref:ABC transporter ATP-binding protein n=1 Tax=Knoellia flava TaxID=913969 RepID=A0A8H9KRB3_9MICO|nr:ATP-binding cassette domain-containing protein [Knoellia flava]GGB71726.1 ABC transporter ATP-binding protein [Knoellia flava]